MAAFANDVVRPVEGFSFVAKLTQVLSGAPRLEGHRHNPLLQELSTPPWHPLSALLARTSHELRQTLQSAQLEALRTPGLLDTE